METVGGLLDPVRQILRQTSGARVYPWHPETFRTGGVGGRRAALGGPPIPSE
jgi:hypothetical protein